MTSPTESTFDNDGTSEYAGAIVATGFVLALLTTILHVLYSIYSGRSLLSESLLVPVGFVALTVGYFSFAPAIYSRIGN